METDVIVIGGGATGTGVAWDLTLRGLRVTLVEMGDIATGTSGRYHGQLHTGCRYVTSDLTSANQPQGRLSEPEPREGRSDVISTTTRRGLVGDPAVSLLQLDQEDEKPILLAVGGLGPYEHVRIGSVPDKVMRAARGPFLFIPWQRMAKAREDDLLSSAEKERVEVGEHQTKILVATDGSKASFHAAERAVHLAGHLRAKLYVLYAVDKDRAFHAGIHYGEGLRELEKAGKEATEKVAALAEKHGLECEKLVVEGGRAARTIVWEAQEVGADYIVMGAEGMSRLESIIIGNVAQEVLEHADRTVLLVGGKRSSDDPMLSPRFGRPEPEVAPAEGATPPETPDRQVAE